MSSDKYTVGNLFAKKGPKFGNNPFDNNSTSGKQFRNCYLNEYFINTGEISEKFLPKNKSFKCSGTNWEKAGFGWVQLNNHWFRVNLVGSVPAPKDDEKSNCKCCGQQLPKTTKPPVPQWFKAALTKIYRGERVLLASRSNYQTTRNEILPQLRSLFDQEGISVNIMRNDATVHFAKFRSTITIISTDSEQKYRGRSVTDMVLMDQIGFYSPDFINWYYSRGTHDYSGN